MANHGAVKPCMYMSSWLLKWCAVSHVWPCVNGVGGWWEEG